MQRETLRESGRIYCTAVGGSLIYRKEPFNKTPNRKTTMNADGDKNENAATREMERGGKEKSHSFHDTNSVTETNSFNSSLVSRANFLF